MSPADSSDKTPPTADPALAIIRAITEQCILSDRDVTVGVSDVAIAVCLLLERAGIATREEIAAQMREAVRQQQSRDGDRHPMTRCIPEYVAKFFELPVFSGKPS
jgi:hypothetical protein